MGPLHHLGAQANVACGSRIRLRRRGDPGPFRPGIAGSAFTPGVGATTDQVSAASVGAFVAKRRLSPVQHSNSNLAHREAGGGSCPPHQKQKLARASGWRGPACSASASWTTFWCSARPAGRSGKWSRRSPSGSSRYTKGFFDGSRLIDNVVYGGLLHSPFPGFRIVAR